MAEVCPFRPLQYDPDRVPIADVVTQPYDKISPEMERRYLDAHPNNVIRLIRPQSDAPAGGAASAYERARQRLEEWRAAGILRQAATPCMFAYFQEFRTPDTGEARVRKGLVCITRLRDYADRVIFPHEGTLEGPKRDRLELLRATRTHLGQVFLLYSDPERRVDALLDGAAARSPEIAFRAENGVDHRLWRIAAPDVIDAIRDALASHKLVIADGHHRYETALTYRDERRRERGGNDAGGSEWLMTTLVNMDSPGMTILPAHRVLSDLDGFDPAALPGAVERYFHVTAVDDASALEARLREAGADRPVVGMVSGNPAACRLLALREGVDVARIADGVTAAQSRLDVVVLHRLILQACLGISEEAVFRGGHLEYVRGFAEAAGRVGASRAQAAFLLNATRLDQVRDIAFGGEVLPQKSTDFFPKLLSGLTLYSLD